MERVQKIFETINKAHGELETIFEELANGEKEMQESVRVACNAYKADLELRENKIKEQIRALEDKKIVIGQKIESMRPELVDATASGNQTAIEKVQKKIAEHKANEAALDVQIDMLYSTPIKGDDELYAIAKELDDKLLEYGEKYDDIFKEVHTFSEEQKNLWEKKHDATRAYTYIQNWGHVSNSHIKSHIGGIEKIHNGGAQCIKRPRVENLPKNQGKNIEISRMKKNDNHSSINQSSGPRMW